MTGAAEHRLRLFLALWPDARVAKQLADFATQWRGRSRLRCVPVSRLHMTLVFLGAVDAPAGLEAVKSVAAGQRGTPFTLHLNQPGHFGGTRGTAWLGPATPPAALLELQHSLRGHLQEVGLAPDTRRYVPHVSLLRGPRRPAPSLCDITWDVRDFVLVSSAHDEAGLRYEILARWTLSA